MSIIPSTLNDGTVPYTVVGASRVQGGGGSASVSVSLVLLDRKPRLFRGETLKDIDRLGFDSIICVEEGAELFEVEALCQRFPRLRFLLLGGPADPGTRINLAIRESQSDWVFVLWNDMSLSTSGLSGRFFERLAEQNLLCLAPFLSTGRGSPLPTLAIPALHKSSLKMLPLQAAHDGASTLYPFDYSGIYSRERFILLGGFDGRLRNPYWQRLDFGFRAWLWGEQIRVAQALRVAYDDEAPTEDFTVDEDYRWVWLKNLAPQFRGDYAVLPGRRLARYLLSRRSDLLGGLREFREARDWVELNRFRFRQDATSLVDLWEDEQR